MRFAGCFVAALMLAAPLVSAQAQDASPYLAQRRNLQAQLDALNAALLSQPSATAVLQGLCNRLDPTSPPIRARKIEMADRPGLAAAARRQMGVGPREPVLRRRVELMCGETVLSRADNWYLPGRLTQRMNSTLQTTERPFGVVVAPLNFQRRTLSSRLLFTPLPEGWEAGPPEQFDQPLGVPANVLQHRAVLQTPDGRPFAFLVETYTNQVLTAP